MVGTLVTARASAPFPLEHRGALPFEKNLQCHSNQTLFGTRDGQYLK